MKKPNVLLENDVRDELVSDPALDQSRITLQAHDGAVTLTGTVDTYAELLRAAADTKKVKGVTSVDNDILVGPIGRAMADADLAAQSTTALDADRFVPHGAVSVTVVDGYATLHGRVRNHFERVAAEHAVGQVFGILGVSNEITMSRDPIPSDIADRINKALGRKAILSNSVINVSNDGHIIYLDGTTDSFAAAQEAENTVWEAPGVTDLVDRLVIIP